MLLAVARFLAPGPSAQIGGGNMEGSFLGLGYHPSAAPKSGPAAPANSNHAYIKVENQTQSSPSSASAVDDYMNQYLQQCLLFHEEQEAMRKQQSSTVPVVGSFPIQASPNHVQPLTFVSGGTMPSNDISEKPLPVVKEERQQTKEAENVTENSSASDLAAAEGRQRAQEILRRFQQQQEQLLYPQFTASHDMASSAPQLVSDQIPEEPPEPSIFLEQRRRGMRREIQRKKHAMLKNLEYVVEKEHRRSQVLQDQIERARLLEEQAKQQYKAATLRRQNQQLESKLVTQAGIGTKKRKQAERIKKQTGHVARPSHEESRNSHSNSTIAIYVSGLPGDGSVTQNFIQQLFGSYGTLEKVHFYKDKTTGAMKGDGLVIYKLDKNSKDHDGSSLVEMVCSQMNGAELSDGVQMKVEPASSNKKPVVKLSREPIPEEGQPRSQTVESAHEEPGDDPDLDDFFDSI